MMHLADQEAADIRVSGGIANVSTSNSLAAIAAGARHDSKKEISMMVSLSHSIYFHNTRAFRANEWVLSELESLWLAMVEDW